MTAKRKANKAAGRAPRSSRPALLDEAVANALEALRAARDFPPSLLVANGAGAITLTRFPASGGAKALELAKKVCAKEENATAAAFFFFTEGPPIGLPTVVVHLHERGMREGDAYGLLLEPKGKGFTTRDKPLRMGAAPPLWARR